MKKFLSLLFVSLFLLVLAACGADDDKTSSSSNGSDEKEKVTIKIGASKTPHAEILEKAKPILEKEGIELQIEEYQDYVLPNEDLANKDLDANYFQHIPYLEQQIKDKGFDFVNAGGIHIEPIGLYSKKYKSLDELPNGAKILISNSVADHGRILSLLEANGLIKLKEGINKVTATLDDIVENPKNLKIEATDDPGMMVTYYENEEGDAVVINSNYAIDAKLNPVKDSIAIESPDNNPYVNIITVRAEDKDNAAIKKLVEVLHSKEIQDFINNTYGGAVIPANE